MVCEIVPLHHKLLLLDDCCTLLNTEWKQSYGVRSHFLSLSNDNMPCSLVLLVDGKVVGHSRLSRVVGEEKTLFLTSVIISRELRGTGLGRKLMSLTEDYATDKGYTSLCLSSDNAGKFYEKCGYFICDPVQQSHAKAINEKLIKLQINQPQKMGIAQNCEVIFQEGVSKNSVPPPPPPPPPLISNDMHSFNKTQTTVNKIWMRKFLNAI